MQYHCVFRFNELMALFEATRKKADVLKTLTIEHLNNKLEHLIVEVPYVQIVICLTHLLTGQWALSKAGQSNQIIGLIIVSRHLLRIQT